MVMEVKKAIELSPGPWGYMNVGQSGTVYDRVGGMVALLPGGAMMEANGKAIEKLPEFMELSYQVMAVIADPSFGERRRQLACYGLGIRGARIFEEMLGIRLLSMISKEDKELEECVVAMLPRCPFMVREQWK